MKYQTNCHKISSKNRRSPSTSPMTFGDVPIKSKEKQGKNKQKRRSDPVSNENQNKIFEESKPANTLDKSLVKRKSLESNSFFSRRFFYISKWSKSELSQKSYCRPF